MLWTYLFFLGLIMIDGIICIIQRIKIIRMFGVSIPVILIIGLIGSMFIGEIILPFPQYYIKWAEDKSLDKILKEEFIKADVKFDEESFKIIDSQGMDGLMAT